MLQSLEGSRVDHPLGRGFSGGDVTWEVVRSSLRETKWEKLETRKAGACEVCRADCSEGTWGLFECLGECRPPCCVWWDALLGPRLPMGGPQSSTVHRWMKVRLWSPEWPRWEAPDPGGWSSVRGPLLGDSWFPSQELSHFVFQAAINESACFHSVISWVDCQLLGGVPSWEWEKISTALLIYISLITRGVNVSS